MFYGDPPSFDKSYFTKLMDHTSSGTSDFKNYKTVTISGRQESKKANRSIAGPFSVLWLDELALTEIEYKNKIYCNPHLRDVTAYNWMRNTSP